MHVASGAAAVLVAQSATKLHAMEAPSTGEQRVRITVEAGGSLEYHPGLAIPFPGSAFRQRVDVALEEGARFAALERWSMGRVGRGERGAFRHLSSRLRVEVAGRPVYADAVELGADAAHTGMMDGQRVPGHGCVLRGRGPGRSQPPEPLGPPTTSSPWAPSARAAITCGASLTTASGYGGRWRPPPTHGEPPKEGRRSSSGGTGRNAHPTEEVAVKMKTTEGSGHDPEGDPRASGTPARDRGRIPGGRQRRQDPEGRPHDRRGRAIVGEGQASAGLSTDEIMKLTRE